jgi:predicted DNA-binding helix-hairpin-helix protein
VCYYGLTMDKLEKLVLMAEAARFEAVADHQSFVRPTGNHRKNCGYTPAELRDRLSRHGITDHVEVNGRRLPIHRAVVPGGRRIPLLRAMLTTACERDCHYCGFHAGRDIRRITFKPEELAKTYNDIHQAGLVDGFFLSSGVFAGGPNTQNLMLDVAEILRLRLGYRGYLHLKIMPGAERDQVLQAMQLADRVSINLEAPNPSRLACLAPSKRFIDELLQPLSWIEEIRKTMHSGQAWGGRWPSSTTQFVVGAAGESDLEILSTVSRLNQMYGLTRAFFEAFTPVQGTHLENHPAENPLREHRLYQASYLLRDYQFDLEDLPFTPEERLPISQDPKLAYAQATLVETPIEINRANRKELLRVPGIGPRGVDAILRTRRHGRFRYLSDLHKIGILAERAAPYITLDGRKAPQQLSLF